MARSEVLAGIVARMRGGPGWQYLSSGPPRAMYRFGYEIRPGSASSELRGRGDALLVDISPKLDQLVADFDGLTAKDLELRFTIVYLSDAGQPRADLIKRVHEVKPHFSLAEIDGAITELEKKGYVGEAATKNASN